jgi:uncharacterized protein DUF2848
MTAARLVLRRRLLGGWEEGLVEIDHLFLAGWTGRDAATVEAHIRELEAIGVARPSVVPCFFTVPPALLTTAAEIEVDGPETSGEVEFVIFSLPGGLWIGLGSDHTDRHLEASDVDLSKRACPKLVGPELWRWADVASHWDRLLLRSYERDGSGRRLCQEGPVSLLRRPDDLMRSFLKRDEILPVGTAMFGGTLSKLSPAGYPSEFEVELEDPVLGRRITHRYSVHVRTAVPRPMIGR